MTTPPPVPSAADTGAGAAVVGGSTGGSGTSIKRRHSRGRSITSRAEMMPSSRPNSAKARTEGGPSPWSDVSQSTSSPPGHDGHTREGQVSQNWIYTFCTITYISSSYVHQHTNVYLLTTNS